MDKLNRSIYYFPWNISRTRGIYQIQNQTGSTSCKRKMVLEERGKFDESQRINALYKLYAPNYMKCWDNQIKCVLESLGEFRGPVVDLASGRGYLAEKISGQLRHPVVVTDFSL